MVSQVLGNRLFFEIWCSCKLRWTLDFVLLFFNVKCTGIMILWFLIGEGAKRARHSQVCSIENRDVCVS